MQGTAADIIKRAMIGVDQWLSSQDPQKIKMIMQVHDELVFEVDDSLLETASATIRDIMESSLTLDVPLQVEIGIGDNWEQAH